MGEALKHCFNWMHFLAHRKSIKTVYIILQPKGNYFDEVLFPADWVAFFFNPGECDAYILKKEWCKWNKFCIWGDYTVNKKNCYDFKSKANMQNKINLVKLCIAFIIHFSFSLLAVNVPALFASWVTACSLHFYSTSCR